MPLICSLVKCGYGLRCFICVTLLELRALLRAAFPRHLWKRRHGCVRGAHAQLLPAPPLVSISPKCRRFPVLLLMHLSSQLIMMPQLHLRRTTPPYWTKPYFGCYEGCIGGMSAETPIILKINPQDLQVQTFTVEKLLEPLIIQVTTLVNCPQNPSNRKKGRSKRARVLLASVEEATWNLLDKGEKIAQEATVLKEELTSALGEVQKESEALKVSAERFTDDPCYLPKREAVVQAARALLGAVTRLLILADMIDVMCLLQRMSSFQRTFESLKNVSNKSDLQKAYQQLGKELENLDYLAFKRQQDLKSPNQRDEIAGARAALKENSPLLHSICSACLEHSDVASLKASKDTVCEEIQNALNVISNASQGIQNMPTPSEPQAATLGSALDELENLIVLNPLMVTEEEIRPSLEKRLEAIISRAALLADSSCTRDFHRERIIAECNAIRQALQDLLSEYMNNAGKKERNNTLNIAIDNMCKKTRDLRRQLRKAIIDHVSDSFLDTTVPLLVLIEAAKNGREKEIKEYAAIFHEHTSRLVEGEEKSLILNI
ncbi:catenin alpha-3 isoform X5 [Heterocephalus glaber]|uniref:Catenin alpha-3 isoform X5 n=1 Tax=Heterocephalus glaber TaxID=10181 RepID=A0AAX6T3P6_HETGA|nr:catenin alpha-3 isoform X5 [Heterocephalus glaber]